MVSNSLKYAFKNRKEREIVIQLKLDQEDVELISHQNKSTFTLSISDNGIGIPSSIDIYNTKSLGLRIVNTLVMQLNAKLYLDKGEGTKFRIVVGEFDED